MNAPHLDNLKPVFSINSVSLESRQLTAQGNAMPWASAGLDMVRDPRVCLLEWEGFR